MEWPDPITGVVWILFLGMPVAAIFVFFEDAIEREKRWNEEKLRMVCKCGHPEAKHAKGELTSSRLCLEKVREGGPGVPSLCLCEEFIPSNRKGGA